MSRGIPCSGACFRFGDYIRLLRQWVFPLAATILIVLFPTIARPQAQDEPSVQLNFGDQVELRVLVDYVSQRLGVKILYDEQVQGNQISIKAPGEVPASSLLQVLESALRMKGLALVDADIAGWKRIQRIEQLQNVAKSQDAQSAIAEFGPNIAVTQTFPLKFFDPQQLNQIVSPFLTQPGANSVTIDDPPMLIVTDYATNVLRIAKLVESIDVARADVIVGFHEVRHASADRLATQLTEIASSKTSGTSATPAKISHDERTHNLIIVGTRQQVDEVIGLARTLDTPLGLQTRMFAVEFTTAERLERLSKQLLSSEAGEDRLQTTLDVDENALFVRSTPEFLQRIEEIRRSIDVPTPQARLPIQFYKIKHVPVRQIWEALRAIERETTDGAGPETPFNTDGRLRVFDRRAVPGPNRYDGGIGGAPPLPPAQQPAEPPANSQGGLNTGMVEGVGEAGLLGRAQVSSDPNTNTLIVVAEPDVQRFYAELIERLDQRRPQVLIEAKLVIINTTDDFSLGIEVSGGDRDGAVRLLGFSSFGLSDVDATSGALALVPGAGFNGTLVDPDVADVVVRALTSHNRARVISAPRILVNDNAIGLLTSVDEVPFTSVNASQTVATTSFAGFAEAGTTITVTPRIGEGDEIELEYQITLNTFTGGGGDGVPPPRQTDELRSEITIPDGHTLIVGGLNRSTNSQDNTGIPFLEKLPLGRYLAGSETRNSDCSSLFVFIRPVILRDDKFADLKFLSEQDRRKAAIPSDLPYSEPVLID